MSARAWKRRRAREAVRAAKRAAKVAGCACAAVATVRRAGTVLQVALAHDEGCPLLEGVDGDGYVQLLVVNAGKMS